MRAIATLAGGCALLCICAAATPTKAPAEFRASGEFVGGQDTPGITVSGVRFGAYDDFTRMVLDLELIDPETGAVTAATAHPKYTVSYAEFPYRLIIKLDGVGFKSSAPVQAKPALPFSVVTDANSANGAIKEMQVFLPGPSEFKLIEIDDPAKLCIDVRPVSSTVPTVFTVQVMDANTASEAYALVEQGSWPDGFHPSVLVLGSVVLIEQAFTSPEAAARVDESLRKLGYESLINERPGDELPLR